MFETDEIICASYLSLVMGVMPKFDWSSGRCYFVFKDNAKLREWLAEFATNPVGNIRDYHMRFIRVRNDMFASNPAKALTTR